MAKHDPMAGPQGLMELSAKLMDYSVRFNLAVAKGVAPAIREYAETAAKAVESAAEHSGKLASCTSAKDALEQQVAFSKALGETFKSSAEKLAAMQKDSGTELKALIDEGMKEFSPEKLRGGS